MRLEDIQADIAVRTESLPFGVHQFYAVFVPDCGWMETDTAQEWDGHGGPKTKLNVFKYEDRAFDFPQHADAHVGVYHKHLAAKRRQVIRKRAEKQDAELSEFRRWKRSRKRAV
jgi:hypothetical protein